MTSKADPIRGQEIQSSLKSLVESTDNWLVAFQKKTISRETRYFFFDGYSDFRRDSRFGTDLSIHSGFLEKLRASATSGVSVHCIVCIFSLVCGDCNLLFPERKA